MQLRPELVAVVEALVTREETHLTLDVIAEAIGAMSISVDEIELVFRALEARNRTVGEEDRRSASAELAITLSTARRLRLELGRAPSAEEIAADAGMSVTSVRSALLFARILQR